MTTKYEKLQEIVDEKKVLVGTMASIRNRMTELNTQRQNIMMSQED